MRLGVFTAVFSKLELSDALQRIKPFGIRTIELATGNFGSDAHIKLEWLKSPAKLKEFTHLLADEGVTISALNCGGNVLHPNRTISESHSATNRNTILLAEALGIPTVIDFAGCPGDSDDAKYPNFVSVSWPPDNQEILKWQWEEKVFPFWRERTRFAADRGVRIAIEMHPGFIVYSPETLLRLRNEVGINLGCNFDPSHLFWQGIDPCMAIRAIGSGIFHVHAKDVRLYSTNASVNGVLDTKSYRDEVHRSWLFRTVGFGHARDFWSDFVSTLQMVGYDDVLSIEHEDSLIAADEGLAKTVAFLAPIVISQKVDQIWWA